MTLEEAVKNNPALVNVPQAVINVAFVGRGYDMMDDYSSANHEKLELVCADLYVELATQPDFREGELSVSYSRDILMRRARNIYLKYKDDKAEETAAYKVPLKITKK